jgi:hypothetical protein
VLDLTQSSLQCVEQRAHLGALEGDRRALRVVLVVAVGRLRRGDDVVELVGQLIDLRQQVGTGGSKPRAGRDGVTCQATAPGPSSCLRSP